MLIIVMIILLGILLAYSVINNHLLLKQDAEAKVFNKCSTNSLRGFAIIMILFSHICQYNVSLKSFLIVGSYRFILSWGAIGVSLFFLLSGYGCYISLTKNNKIGIWLLKHVTKLIVHFIIAFFVVLVFKSLVCGQMIPIKEVVMYFLTLRIPGSTVWYLKIQILFYIILALSVAITKKYSYILVTLFSLMYAFLANYALHLPDFWWKTSLCFSAGCYLVQYQEVLERITKRKMIRISLAILGCIAWALLIKDGRCRMLVQIPGYVIVSICILLIWDFFLNKGNVIMRYVGNYSLDIYLVHIGIVESIFILSFGVSLKIVIFVLLTVLGTVISYFVSEKIYQNIVTKHGIVKLKLLK